jgi:hypothetical protein
MNEIKRSTLIAEELIRTYVRNRIEKSFKTKRLAENKLRKVVRSMILETETGTEEASTYTGINVLASLLEKIIPVLEIDYKMLTTSEEQRESFRNHIIHAIKNTIRPIDVTTVAEKIPESYEFEIDEETLSEKIVIDIEDEEEASESIEGEFIDIDGDGDSDADDFVVLDDQNETGRNFAATSFKKIEKQIVDAYDMLADEKDQDLFYDYLLTNALLYFDKFEDELAPELPDTTTPEYEDEVDKAVEASETAEEDSPSGDEGDLLGDEEFDDL